MRPGKGEWQILYIIIIDIECCRNAYLSQLLSGYRYISSAQPSPAQPSPALFCSGAFAGYLEACEGLTRYGVGRYDVENGG